MPNPSEIERLELSICPDKRTLAEILADERDARIWNALNLEQKQPSLDELEG